MRGEAARWASLGLLIAACGGVAEKPAREPPAATRSDMREGPVLHEVEASVASERPPLALVIVVPRSQVSFDPVWVETKKACVAAASELRMKELFSIIVFDAVPEVVVPLGNANTDRIEAAFDRRLGTGEAEVRSALAAAYAMLESRTGVRGHVLLMSDGRASQEGVVELVDRYRAKGITTSTVGFGAGADHDLLSKIADRGEGMFSGLEVSSDLVHSFVQVVQVKRASPH